MDVPPATIYFPVSPNFFLLPALAAKAKLVIESTVVKICPPEATISGLMRPSRVGPLLELLAISFCLPPMGL